MLTLYGCNGCGSAAIEALLRLYGEETSCVRWDWTDEAAWSKFATVTAQRQVPTLVLTDGTVMTESAAMVCWLVQRFPGSPLLPPTDSQRALMYRWLIYISVHAYTPIGIKDFPERWLKDGANHEALKVGAIERIKASWQLMETEISPTPFLLGETMTALDVYSAMVRRFTPGTKWCAEHCPKIDGAARETEKNPVVREVFTFHFGELDEK
jgi:GST-like protein